MTKSITGSWSSKEGIKKVLKFKQHTLINKLWDCPGGNTMSGTMSSLFDAGLNYSDTILETEEHMT